MPKLSTIRLTDTLIRSLKPKEHRYDVYDASQPGFGIRVATSGALSWVLLTRDNGRRKRVTLGVYPAMSLGKAREAARVVLSVSYSPNLGQLSGLFKLLPAPADRFQCG